MQGLSIDMRFGTGWIAALVTLLLGLCGAVPEQAAQPAAPLVTIESLDSGYTSCGIVNFAVRNTSRQDGYVEVYVEDLKQGAWEEAWCQYNLNDPAGRLIKRVWQNPKMMKPGEALAVRYDRCTDYEICVKPKFPKNDTRASRQGLQEQDAHAAAPVSQRIRVEVFVKSGRSLKEAGRVWSTPFTRKPAG
jgi:hypothetical protein